MVDVSDPKAVHRGDLPERPAEFDAWMFRHEYGSMTIGKVKVVGKWGATETRVQSCEVTGYRRRVPTRALHQSQADATLAATESVERKIAYLESCIATERAILEKFK